MRQAISCRINKMICKLSVIWERHTIDIYVLSTHIEVAIQSCIEVLTSIFQWETSSNCSKITFLLYSFLQCSRDFVLMSSFNWNSNTCQPLIKISLLKRGWLLSISRIENNSSQIQICDINKNYSAGTGRILKIDSSTLMK